MGPVGILVNFSPLVFLTAVQIELLLLLLLYIHLTAFFQE